MPSTPGRARGQAQSGCPGDQCGRLHRSMVAHSADLGRQCFCVSAEEEMETSGAENEEGDLMPQFYFAVSMT